MDMTAFRRQGGVASVATLHSSGVTDDQIRWAVTRGALSRIRHGWLQTADADPDIVAAVAAGGRLGCISAAARHGLWVPESAGLHVSLPRHAGRHQSAAVTAHWEGDRWRDSHSPIEPVASMLRQLILCCDRDTAVSVIDSALHRRKLTMTGLARIISSLPETYSWLSAEVDAKSESGYESMCRVRLARLGFALRTQVAIAGVGRVDMLLGDRLIIEADGWEWHNGADAFAVDRSRDLAAHRQGYLPLRLAPVHIEHEWPWVERVVTAIVERGEHRWSDRQIHQRANHGFGG